MTTKFSIKVTLMNGETLTYKDEEALTFEMQDRGLMFVHSALQKEFKKMGVHTVKVHYRYSRSWIPYVQIKTIEVITNKEIDDPEEIKKYDEFLKHGIDIMMTNISYTAPKTPEQVQKEIDEEKQPKTEPKPADTVTETPQGQPEDTKPPEK